MKKKLFFVLATAFLLNSSEYVGLATYGKLIEGMSEQSEFVITGTPQTINLKTGESKPLNFSLKVTDKDQKDPDSAIIFIESDNIKIARIKGGNSIKLSSAFSGGQKQLHPDGKLKEVRSAVQPVVEAVSPGETFVAVYFKKNFINFKVIVSP